MDKDGVILDTQKLKKKSFSHVPRNQRVNYIQPEAFHFSHTKS